MSRAAQDPTQLCPYIPGQSATLSRLAELKQESSLKRAFHFELPFELRSLYNGFKNYMKSLS